MNSECRASLYKATLLCVLIAAIISLAGCTNPEKAKAEHIRKGEAYLTDSKFQEASLEFRNAIQIDEKFAGAHWGLARSYEGLQHWPEMFQELQRTVELDPNNLDARVKLGNYYLQAARGKADIIGMAEKEANAILQKDPNNIEGHILMGSVLFNQNKRDEAFAELNKAIQIDPKRVESYLSLARAYIAIQDRDKAEQQFKLALSVNPNSALAHTEYGKFLVQTNRPAEAQAELEKAVEVDPKDRPARFVLASYYLVNKQIDKAETSFKALAALDPDKPESQTVLADFYATVGRVPESIKIYQDILAKSPDFAQGRYRLTEIMLMNGDTQGASAQIAEALKKDPGDRQALLMRARLRAQGGQTDGLKAAIEDLKEVLKQEPNSRGGLYFMASANFALGYMDQARTFAGDLEKNYPDYLPAKLIKAQITLGSRDPRGASTMATELLSRLDKTAPDRENSAQLLAEIREKAYLARGSAQLQLQNTNAARQDFEAARNVNPNDPTVYNSLAVISVNEKKQDEAVSNWESALKIDGTNFQALNGLIGFYAQQQAYDKAHGRIDQAISTNPNSASLHFLKAQVFGFQHNAQGTEGELRKAIELDPNYVAAYFSLGNLFINSGQTDRAIAEYQEIIKRRPDDQTAYTMIGMLEDARKNYDAAVENYKKALEKDPNTVIAANNLAWLYAVTGKGNLDEAVKLAQGVVQKNPNIAGFVDTLGWVYYKKSLYGAAAEQLQKAVTLDEEAARVNKVSPSASYHYHLGMALKGKGDAAGAKRELEASIRLADKAPFADIEEAKKALTSL
jgi:tetratricopeptide (TPR) repeat protein